MKIEIHPAAQAELSDASTYYETKVPGLGEDFLGEFHGAIEQITRHAEIGVLVDAPHRRGILNRTRVYRVNSYEHIVIDVARRIRFNYFANMKVTYI